jgi:adenylate cyclase
MSETRKLAAILVSDVVGYSRLAGADEDRILARLRALRSDLIDPTIAVHHGRVVKRTGDGAIVEFRSVVDAVNCAIEVQRAMVERNAEVAAEKRIEFRVGVHLGDVVEESDGDLMGDGVNIAARLQGVAKPGGICVSDDAYRQVKSRLDLRVSDLGLVSLKNIAEPMRAYSLEVGTPPEARLPPNRAKQVAAKSRWLSASLAAVAALLLLLVAAGGWYMLGGGLTKPTQVAHLSLVVLPFANLSGDPSQEYFSDGVTENLTTELSRFRDSFVIARNTAFTYKGKSVDAKEIGKELGVRYVLEGSVQRDQGRVRVNAQLIDAESGSHLWAESFDKPLTDLFSMQDEIVASLSSQLGTQLAIAEARRVERASSPDSMDLYFQGLAALNKGLALENVARAHDLYDRALAADPDNIDAQIGLAVTDILNAANFFVADRKASYAAAETGLNKVLSFAPDDALAHMWLGFVDMFTQRADQAIVECQHALELDRNLAAAHSCLGYAKILIGRPEETEAHINEALRLSPRDTYTSAWMQFACLAKTDLQKYEEAVGWCRRSVEANRNFANAYFVLGSNLARLGRLDEARSAVKTGLVLNPHYTLSAVRAYYEGSYKPGYLPTGLPQRIEVLRGLGVPGGDEKTN